MAKSKKIREILIDYPPDEPKEATIGRMVNWPQTLFDFINKVASKKKEPFMHVVIKAMRIWAKKQEVSDEN